MRTGSMYWFSRTFGVAVINFGINSVSALARNNSHTGLAARDARAYRQASVFANRSQALAP